MTDVVYAFQPNAFQADAFANISSGGSFAAFLAQDVGLRCCLVELDYIYESLDSPTAPATGTLYFSDREFFDDVTNNPYVDCVKAAPQYTRQLSGEQLGTYVSSVGTLELDNADGELDFLLSVACDGSQIRFYLGNVEWPVADFVHVFTAIIAKVIAPSWDRISVALKDTGLLLDKSIGGTNPIGGTGPNADRSQQVNMGYIHNLTALVEDQATLTYRHSDIGTFTSAQEVRDRGVSVYYTDNADGTFTLGASPAGLITCDVLAEPLGNDNVRVSHHMLFFVGDRAGLSALGLYNGPGPTFTTEDQDDYKLGVSVAEARNVQDLLAEIIISGNCFWAVKRTGEFTFGRLRLNDIASFGLSEVNIYEDDIDQGSFRVDHAATQYYKYQAYMSRNWTRQTDFASSLTPDEQATYSRPGLFVVQPDSVGTTYAAAPELYHKTLAVSPQIETLLSEVFSFSDVDSLAQWMTTRRAIFLPWIEIVSLTVTLEFYPLELGDVVRLIIPPRMGQEDETGVLFQVISITIRLTDAKVDLKLARRNVVQEIPPSWTRLVTLIDSSQQEYLPAPPAVQTVEINPPSTQTPGAGEEPSHIDDTGKWRLVYVRAKRGVHPDVWLWVPFYIDGTAKDISVYNRTPNITMETGTLDANGLAWDFIDALDTNRIVLIDYNFSNMSSLASANPALTFEGFVEWDVSANNTDPFTIFECAPSTLAPDVRRYAGYANAGDVQYNDSGAGIEAGPTSSTPLAPTGTLYHWAWIIPSGASGQQYWYINGVQVLTRTTGAVNLTTPLSAGARFRIGGTVNTNGGAPSHAKGRLFETRVVARNLYPSGTTFTPPTPGNLSVIS